VLARWLRYHSRDALASCSAWLHESACFNHHGERARVHILAFVRYNAHGARLTGVWLVWPWLAKFVWKLGGGGVLTLTP
jgi:hypothetical protein